MQLQIHNISKTYPNGVEALSNVSLTINKGMFGLLGPNGAGKSSLMRTIATLQDADKGDITFKDKNIFEDKINLRNQLGYLPQDFGVYKNISAYRLLDYLCQLKNISDKKDRKKMIDYVLNITNLTEVQKKKVSSYSSGMKKRFGIAQHDKLGQIIYDDLLKINNIYNSIQFYTQQKVSKIEIDPDLLLIDINREDNIWNIES